MINNVDVLSGCLAKKMAVFVAGSGISYASGLLSAREVLLESSALFLPTDTRYRDFNDCMVHRPASDPAKRIDPASARDILPEVFYEQVLGLVNSIDALQIWRCLDRETSAKYGPEPRANINHKFIVDYSASAGMPIFTTNFDDLFEDAANSMNYDPQVVVPYTEGQRETIARILNRDFGPREVFIFKLHGSIRLRGALTLETLSTTMSSISAVNYEVIEFVRRLLTEKKRIVFTGYSGQDIDLFPQIMALPRPVQPIWIDRFTSIPNSGATARMTETNCRAINAVPVTAYPHEAFSVLAPALNIAPAILSVDAKRQMLDDLKNEVGTACPLSEEQKILLCGLCLESSGYTRHASNALALSADRLERNLPEKHLIQYHLACAHSCDGLARYEDAQAAAKKAMALTRSGRHPGESDSAVRAAGRRATHIIARHQMVMAATLAGGPAIRYGFREFRFLPRYRDIGITAFRYSFEVWYLRWLLEKALHEIGMSISMLSQPSKANLLRKPSYSLVLTAVHRWLDTRILFFSYLLDFMAAIRLVRAGFVRKALFVYLAAIDKTSQDVGDYFARANVLKYWHRLEIRDPSEAVAYYRPFGEFGGRALVFRDAAVRSLRKKDRHQAMKDFLEAYKLALLAGHNATILKALVGLAVCGSKAARYVKRYDRLEAQMQGRGYKRYFAALRGRGALTP